MKRIVVFGNAESLSGTVTFRCDGVREESYPIEGVYDVMQGILIYQECSMDMTGFVPEIELNLTGKVIVLRDSRLEFVVLD